MPILKILKTDLSGTWHLGGWVKEHTYKGIFEFRRKIMLSNLVANLKGKIGLDLMFL